MTGALLDVNVGLFGYDFEIVVVDEAFILFFVGFHQGCHVGMISANGFLK
jgi:hypothetical protein